MSSVEKCNKLEWSKIDNTKEPKGEILCENENGYFIATFYNFIDAGALVSDVETGELYEVNKYFDPSLLK